MFKMAKQHSLTPRSSGYLCLWAQRGITFDIPSSWFVPPVVGIPPSLELCSPAACFRRREAPERGLLRPLNAPMPTAREVARQQARPERAVRTRVVMRYGGDAGMRLPEDNG